MNQTNQIVRREFQSRGYTGTFDQDQRRQKGLLESLQLQRFAFSHFVTVTFPEPVSEVEALEPLNNGLRTLDGYNQRRVRYFYSLSLDRPYWYWQSGEDDVGDVELRARWHIHLLLGGLNGSITTRQIEESFRQFGHGYVQVKKYDHCPKLCNYLTETHNGNFIGGLQNTNDRTIKNAMARIGEPI